MDKEVNNRYAQKLIEQIGKLQSIDLEKHKYFSKRAIDALQEMDNGNYEDILGLEIEVIDYLEDRIRSSQRENILPIKHKTSFIERISKFFSKENEENGETEISRIAQMITESTDGARKDPNSDIRTPVYDFFRDEIENNGKLRRWNTSQRVSFTNSEGYQRTFNIGIDEFGIGEINIGECTIVTYKKAFGDELYTHVIRDGIEEYLNLIKFDQFINAKTGDKSFINEFGRLVTEMSRGYSPQDIDASFNAGKRLDKALLKNPIYKQMKESFDKAYKEYVRTFAQFRQNEANRRDDTNNRNAFVKGISVNEISREDITDTRDTKQLAEDKEQDNR